MTKKKVVIFGGGTGPICTLKLPEYNYDVTVIVSVVDDGGSTGDLLRDNPSILPPGDPRRVISNSSQNPIFQETMEKRINYDCPVENSSLENILRYYVDEAYALNIIRQFKDHELHEAIERDLGIENLKGHSFGNILLMALMLEYGNTEGLEKMCDLAETSVNVIPASEDHATFRFMSGDMEKPSDGEHLLDDFSRRAKPIDNCWLEPSLEPYREALGAIDDAEVVVISPTSIYANIVSILLIPGFSKALKKKKIVWVGNIMTEWNQTAYSGLSLNGIGHLEEVLERYLGRYPDMVLAPKFKDQSLSAVLGNYDAEGASSVLYRRKDFEKHGIKYMDVSDMINEVEIEYRGRVIKVLRHNPDKVADYLDSIIRMYL